VRELATVDVTSPSDGVAIVALNRPSTLNAMSVELVSDLHEALAALAADRDCRVVILTGTGRGFCSGLDLGGFGTAPGAEGLGVMQAGLMGQKHIASLIPRLRSMPQPVIAAVNGAATGGGLALVLGSDVRIAARSARFSVAFVRIGLSGCDIGTSWLLPRVVGVARAQELMLTGRIIGSDEALRIGLVVDVVDDGELLDTAQTKAREILQNAPAAVAMTKEAMWAALEIGNLQSAIDLENRQQLMLTATEDHREALSAFLERRAPDFHNR
jgi:enoyl-CoA hydratase/carnithine racemase